jgi:hypothetical protein
MIAVLAIGLGLIRAARVYEVRLAPPSERVVQRDDRSVAVKVSTGVGFVPGVDPITAVLAVAVATCVAGACYLRRRGPDDPAA